MLDPAFVADCPYGEGGLLLDDVVELDASASRVVVRMPTHDALPLTQAQRAHPIRHPRHVSGGLMLHMTGMAAFAHAWHLMGLRHSEGWVGYGVRIHSARFHKLAPPGVPLLIECTMLRCRRREKQMLSRYRFLFTQDDTLVYDGEQSAMWLRTEVESESPLLSASR